MTVDEILKAPAPIVGALAVVCAAALSASVVMLTALVNSQSARRIAKDAFRRELLMKSAEPLLKRLNDQVALLEQVNTVLATVRTIPVEVWNGTAPGLTAQAKQQHVEELDALLAGLSGAQQLWLHTAETSVIFRDGKVGDLLLHWWGTFAKCGVLLVSESKKIRRGDELAASRMKQAVRDASYEVVHLRIAIEEWLIDPPGWVSRQAYAVRRRFKKEGMIGERRSGS